MVLPRCGLTCMWFGDNCHCIVWSTNIFRLNQYLIGKLLTKGIMYCGWIYPKKKKKKMILWLKYFTICVVWALNSDIPPKSLVTLYYYVFRNASIFILQRMWRILFWMISNILWIPQCLPWDDSLECCLMWILLHIYVW